jgi:ribosome-binding protein aMBF1 (putative translation factor)
VSGPGNSQAGSPPANSDARNFVREQHRHVARVFGVVLRTVRHERGISQEALSDSAGLDRTYPSLLERGLRQPTLAMLLRIAEALGVEPAQLVNQTVARLRGL